MDNIVEKELSYSIVKAAYEVFNELGPGFDENIYEEAMIVVLKKYNNLQEQQKRVDIVNSKRRKINSAQTNF